MKRVGSNLIALRQKSCCSLPSPNDHLTASASSFFLPSSIPFSSCMNFSEVDQGRRHVAYLAKAAASICKVPLCGAGQKMVTGTKYWMKV